MKDKADKHLHQLSITAGSPSQKYIKFAKLKQEDSVQKSESIYFSHAVSSGGYVLVEGSNKKDAITKNLDFIDKFTQILVDTNTISPYKYVITPSKFSSMDDWNGIDFTIFWSMVMLGVDLNKAEEIENLCYSLFEDRMKENFHTMSRDKVLQSYYEIADRMLSYLEEHSFDFKPIDSLYKLLDNDRSLGCLVESYLADKLEIPQYVVQISDIDHPTLTSLNNHLRGLNKITNFFSNYLESGQKYVNKNGLVIVEV